MLSMRHIVSKTLGLAVALCLAGAWVQGRCGTVENWPGWRGARGDGVSFETGLPVSWGAGTNIAWSAELPGRGHASPIVWGDRVFTVSAVAETEERLLLCFDRRTGSEIWRKTVIKAPFEHKHELNSHASSTPATDGETVYAAFLDVQEMAVAAYDIAGGNLRWLVHPGPFKSTHGFCSSPVIYKDKLIVNGDHDGDSYILALNRKDGSIAWKIPRKHHTRSYCVPTIYEAGGRTQMVLSGDMSIASYNPDDGAAHWYFEGPTEQFVASVVFNRPADLFLVTGGFPDHHLLALRTGGSGIIDANQIVWRTNRASCVSYVPSPITVGEYFLIVSDPGYANCFKAATGELLWQERLGEHHASLVSADGLVYFLSDEGVTTVVKPGAVFERVARNELSERCFASPALSRGNLFIRGERHLFCIGTSPK